ncbi:hypothetical protein ACJ72_06765 [Emergomyces africanus]|uniref:Uncharacterized protein n=1 Tax=Emergomyces africanus TaxID=1955775 RepID=A0A1B7NQ23_9EURO|nr:hypothetical protein ACJ72_06765 [Emergomyces africanus]
MKRLKKGVSRATLALEDCAEESGREVKEVKTYLTEARLSMLLLHKAGPADLVGLDEKNIMLWRRYIPLSDLEEILDLRSREFPAEVKHFRGLDHVAAKVMIDGLKKYGWELQELAPCTSEVMEILFLYIDRNRLAEGSIDFLDPVRHGTVGQQQNSDDNDDNDAMQQHDAPYNAEQTSIPKHPHITTTPPNAECEGTIVNYTDIYTNDYAGEGIGIPPSKRRGIENESQQMDTQRDRSPKQEIIPSFQDGRVSLYTYIPDPDTDLWAMQSGGVGFPVPPIFNGDAYSQRHSNPTRSFLAFPHSEN